ncbi:MAG: hypothetical protein V9E93_13495 [Steroidobacteraceae bacterium]
MPEKRRKNVQTRLWIAAIAIPAGERSHGTGVAQIVQAWGRDAGWDHKMEPPHELRIPVDRDQRFRRIVTGDSDLA